MGRPHIEFIDALAVASEPVTDGLFAGVSRRVLSADGDGSGDYTAIVELAPGWAGDLSGGRRPVEMVVLDGALQLGRRTAGPGVYLFVPAHSAGATLDAAEGAVALVMVEPESAGTGPCEVIDTHEMPWVSPPAGGPVPQGIVVKRVRIDAASGDVSWVAAVVPGWRESRAEIHDTIEECLMLKGDILLGHRGVMGPGSYFWRPPQVAHGPMFSLNGGVFFFRSKGGGLTTRHIEVPGWHDMVARYVASQPYFGGLTSRPPGGGSAHEGRRP